jgi:hypothetical protein
MKNTRIYLYYPILFLFLFLLFSQVFTLSFFKEKFLQTGNVVYYRQRPFLLERLKKEYSQKQKKLAIVFGDSRAYSYSDKLLQNSENWSIYNFSAPQAVPAYSLYWMEKLEKASIYPDVIWFVISPEGFHDAKKLMFKPFLRLSGEDAFVRQHWNHIPAEDRYEYLLDKLIPLRAIEFDSKLFMERYRNKKLSEYDPAKNLEWSILNLFKGEQLAYASLVNQDEKLKADALRMANIYLYGYTVDDTQFYYVEKVLELAKRRNTKVILIWPCVYKEYFTEYSKYQINEKWWSRIQALSDQYSMQTLDLNSRWVCDKFYDSSHQSAACFMTIIPNLIQLSETKIKKE